MSTASLDTLLEKLANGESEAAERVFRNYEPFLRAMVRRRLTPPLRAKFDSMDVVQSVWADVLQGLRQAEWQFDDQDHLRAFLARVTHNHFVNHCRRHGPALEREQPFLEDEASALAATGHFASRLIVQRAMKRRSAMWTTWPLLPSRTSSNGETPTIHSGYSQDALASGERWVSVRCWNV